MAIANTGILSTGNIKEVGFLGKTFDPEILRTKKIAGEVNGRLKDMLGENSALAKVITAPASPITKVEMKEALPELFGTSASDKFIRDVSTGINGLSSLDMEKINKAGKNVLGLDYDSPMCQLLALMRGEGKLQLPRLGLLLSGLISVSYSKCSKGVFDELVSKITNEPLKRAVTVKAMEEGIETSNRSMVIDVSTSPSAKNLVNEIPTIASKLSSSVTEPLSKEDTVSLLSAMDNVDPDWRSNDKLYKTTIEPTAEFTDSLEKVLPTPDKSKPLAPMSDNMLLYINAKNRVNVKEGK